MHGYTGYPIVVRRQFSDMKTHIRELKRSINAFRKGKAIDAVAMVGHLVELGRLDLEPANALRFNHPLIGVPFALQTVDERLMTMAARRELHAFLKDKFVESNGKDAQLKRIGVDEEMLVEGEKELAEDRNAHRALLNACVHTLEGYEQTPESKTYGRLINGLHGRIKEIYKKLA